MSTLAAPQIVPPKAITDPRQITAQPDAAVEQGHAVLERHLCGDGAQHEVERERAKGDECRHRRTPCGHPDRKVRVRHHVGELRGGAEQPEMVDEREADDHETAEPGKCPHADRPHRVVEAHE